MTQQLSPHFTLAELIKSQTATRRGLSNQPTPAIMPNLKRLAGLLEDIRAYVGGPIIVNSGYRSPAVNAAVGGSETSAHMKGLAADIYHPNMTPFELATKIKASDIIMDQLILEFPDADGWVHVGLSLGTPRRQVLTIKRGTGYKAGLIP